jgi:hypothetical protein
MKHLCLATLALALVAIFPHQAFGTNHAQMLAQFGTTHSTQLQHMADSQSRRARDTLRRSQAYFNRVRTLMRGLNTNRQRGPFVRQRVRANPRFAFARAHLFRASMPSVPEVRLPVIHTPTGSFVRIGYLTRGVNSAGQPMLGRALRVAPVEVHTELASASNAQ